MAVYLTEWIDHLEREFPPGDPKNSSGWNAFREVLEKRLGRIDPLVSTPARLKAPGVLSF